jgi:TrpR family trp operon transcriptional repressor
MNAIGWRCFLTLCLETKDEKTLSELFELLLTSEERSSLETRCLIVQELLAQKKTQRQIAEEHKVSIAKITRGSNELKRMSPDLIQHLKTTLLPLY